MGKGFLCVSGCSVGVRYLFGVYEVLDFMVEAGTVVGVMAFLLVVLAVLAQVKMFWWGVLKWFGF